MSDFFRFETRNGEPLQASGWTITPVTRVAILRFPFFNSGLIWNRPIEVQVQAADGPVQKLYVPDVTRQVQLTILGGSVLVSFLLWLVFRQRRGSNG